MGTCLAQPACRRTRRFFTRDRFGHVNASHVLCSTIAYRQSIAVPHKRTFFARSYKQSACPWHVVNTTSRSLCPPGQSFHSFMSSSEAGGGPIPTAGASSRRVLRTTIPVSPFVPASSFRCCQRFPVWPLGPRKPRAAVSKPRCAQHHLLARRRAHHCLAVSSLALRPVLLGPHSPTTAFHVDVVAIEAVLISADQNASAILQRLTHLVDLTRHRSPHRQPQWFPC